MPRSRRTPVTHLRMYKARQGRGYPANFPSLLAHFKCETCAVTLGARSYRTSKRVKDKGYHTKRQQESEVIPDISRHTICLARASKPKKKRRKSKKIKKAKEPVIAAPVLDAAPLLAAGVAPRLVHPPPSGSIVCILTTLTVSLLGVIRSNTI